MPVGFPAPPSRRRRWLALGAGAAVLVLVVVALAARPRPPPPPSPLAGSSGKTAAATAQRAEPTAPRSAKPLRSGADGQSDADFLKSLARRDRSDATGSSTPRPAPPASSSAASAPSSSTSRSAPSSPSSAPPPSSSAPARAPPAAKPTTTTTTAAASPEDVVFLTYANRKLGRMCDMLRSAVVHGFRVVVLGWEPDACAQGHEYHLGSKLYLALRYIDTFLDGAAPGGLADSYRSPLQASGDVPGRGQRADDTLLLFADATDVLVQVDIEEVIARYESKQADIVFATEHDMWPPNICSNYPGPQGPHVYRHLNSGAWMARATAMRALLDAAIADDESYRRHEVRRNRRNDVVYEGDDRNNELPAFLRRNDQIIYQMLFCANGRERFGMTLDYTCELFQSMLLPRHLLGQHLALRERHVHNVAGGADVVPALLHYNGGAKDYSGTGVDLGPVADALRAAHAEPADMAQRFERQVAFVDRDMRAVRVTLADVCS